METLELYIPGCPIALPRTKATTIGGRTRVYTPVKRKTKHGLVSNGVAEFKALVRKIGSEQHTGAPLRGPLRIDCCFVFPRWDSQIWKRKPMVRLPHTGRPDRDNLDKMVLDSLKDVVIADDRSVYLGTIEKWHAAGDEQPHTLVTIHYSSEALEAKFAGTEDPAEAAEQKASTP